MTAPRILVVCTANICRSPVAEKLLQTRLAHAGLADWTVASAGTWAAEGHTAAPFSMELMAERGLDINPHRSQPVTESLMQQVDLVICLETNHAETLRHAYPNDAFKIETLRGVAGEQGSVADPYGRSRRQYQQMVTEVHDLIEAGFSHIQVLARENFKRRNEDGSS